MTTRIHNPDAWTASLVGNKFQVYKLALRRDEFTVVPTSIPFQCRFPAPNDTFGVNTYRGNAFVQGAFQIVPHASTPFNRYRGEEMVAVRWATEGGAEFLGLEDYNEFWCVMLRDPSEGIYLQANYPLPPGESVVIPNRELERNLFVLEGAVEVQSKTLSSFSHAKLTKDQEYVITNTSDESAFVLYFYQVTPDEFIAAGEPTFPAEKYKTIPILSDEYWSEPHESV